MNTDVRCVCVCVCMCVCVCVRERVCVCSKCIRYENRRTIESNCQIVAVCCSVLQCVAVCGSVLIGSSIDYGFTVEEYIYLYIVPCTEIFLLAPAHVEERAYNICHAQRSVRFLSITDSDTRIIARDPHPIF